MKRVMVLAVLVAGCGGGGGGSLTDVPADVAAPDLPAEAVALDVPAETTIPDVPGESSPDLPAETSPGDAPADLRADVPEEADAPATDAPSSPIAAVPGARCAPSSRIGVVSVFGYEYAETLDASVEVLDRPSPWIGEPALSDDACAFFSFQPGGCGTCPAGKTCGRSGSCVPEAAPVAGAKLVLGAGGQTQAFGGGGQTWGQVTLPGRAFAADVSWEGVAVTLAETAVPGKLDGLSAKLAGDSMAPDAFDLAWTPPAEAGSSVHTLVPINHHAAGPTFTDCSVAASAGAMHIDGAMLKPLSVVTGLEFQGIEHARFAAAETPVGCLEFRFQVQQYVNASY
ncbi:MAG: hypothetical protein FJ087_13365 [Deltaproteobacteria bacterium]|nr:hypothetical protein [Deltaproteobacteria bacterium]